MMGEDVEGVSNAKEMIKLMTRAHIDIRRDSLIKPASEHLRIDRRGRGVGL